MDVVRAEEGFKVSLRRVRPGTVEQGGQVMLDISISIHNAPSQSPGP